jgi:hypothetical protein
MRAPVRIFRRRNAKGKCDKTYAREEVISERFSKVLGNFAFGGLYSQMAETWQGELEKPAREI